jgi:type II secretory pathway component PulM
MSALSDRARDFWDRISPRERWLVVLAAIATPVVIAIWLGLAIHDGLDAMEDRNARTRKALTVLADLRARGQTHEQVDDVVATMGIEPLSLDTYLNNAAKKAQFELKSVITPHTPKPRNGFVTSSSSLTLDKLTIQQLKDFLQQIESGSKVVAVTHLQLDRNIREDDKVNVTLEVSTYSKEPPPKGEGSGSGSGSDSGSGSADDKKGS